MKLDYLIRNAKVCTGLAEKAKIRDIGILGDKIVPFEVANTSTPAKHIVEAEGKILAPGFIDPHASTGFGYFFPNAADHKLYQGITTEIFGNCGTSPAPIGPQLMATMQRLSGEIGFPFDWTSMQEYFDRITDHLQFNIATLIGHSTLRGGYLDDWKSLSTEQLSEMKTALSSAMDEGAIGFSTGLILSLIHI